MSCELYDVFYYQPKCQPHIFTDRWSYSEPDSEPDCGPHIVANCDPINASYIVAKRRPLRVAHGGPDLEPVYGPFYKTDHITVCESHCESFERSHAGALVVPHNQSHSEPHDQPYS